MDPDFLALLTGLSQDEFCAHRLTELRDSDPLSFLLLASNVILADDVPDALVSRAMMLISVVLTVRDSLFVDDRVSVLWKSVPESQRSQLNQAFLRGLMFADSQIRARSARLLAGLMRIERDMAVFQMLFALLKNEEGTYPPEAQLGALLALRELLDFRVISGGREHQGIGQAILGIGLAVISTEGPPPVFVAAAIELLNSALGVFKKAMVNDQLLLAIVRHWGVDDFAVHSEIYRILITLFRIVPVRIRAGMTVLFGLIIGDLQTGDTRLCGLVLGFWGDIAKVERRSGSAKVLPDVAPALIPALVQVLSEVGDAPDDDSDAYATSLSRPARKILTKLIPYGQDDFLQVLQHFATTNFDSEDWRLVFAALSVVNILLRARCLTYWLQAELHAHILPLCSCGMGILRGLAFDCVVRCIARSSGSCTNEYIFVSQAEMREFVVGFCPGALQNEATAELACTVARRFALTFPEADEMVSPLGPAVAPLAEALMGLAGSSDPAVLTGALSAIRELIRRAPLSADGARSGLLATAVGQLEGLPRDAGTTAEFLITVAGVAAASIRLAVDTSLLAKAFEIVWAREDRTATWIAALGEIAVSSPDIARMYSDRLLPMLADGQKSDDPAFVVGTAVVIGDLFHKMPELVVPFTGEFAEALLGNINRPEITVSACVHLIYTLGDVCVRAGEGIAPYAGQMMAIVDQFSAVRFEPMDKASVRAAEDVFAAVIYLSAQIFVAKRADDEFIEAHIGTVFRPFTTATVTVELFHSEALHLMLMRFLEDLAAPEMPTRKYSRFLNHLEIMRHLNYIRGRRRSPLADRAYDLIALLSLK
jgi:hypothetical protein